MRAAASLCYGTHVPLTPLATPRPIVPRAVLAAPWLRWCGTLALLGIAGAWVVAYLIPHPTDPQGIIIHSTTTFGADALGARRDLFSLPIIGTVVVVINIVLATVLGRSRSSAGMSRCASLATLLMVASPLLAFAVLVGMTFLWYVNTHATP